MQLPLEVTLEALRVGISWSDGHRSVFSNMRLREGCPCAACRGEPGILGKLYMLPSGGEIPRDIHAVTYSLVGRYAVSFVWSDGHRTGIYPYDYLLSMCECGKCPERGSA